MQVFSVCILLVSFTFSHFKKSSPTLLQVLQPLIFKMRMHEAEYYWRWWWWAEMITIRFTVWISGRIVILQPDTDIRNLLWNGNRIRIRISETLLLIFRGFRLLEKVAHCTIIHLLSSSRSILSAICAMTPSLSMVYSLYHSVISFPS